MSHGAFIGALAAFDVPQQPVRRYTIWVERNCSLKQSEAALQVAVKQQGRPDIGRVVRLGGVATFLGDVGFLMAPELPQGIGVKPRRRDMQRGLIENVLERERRSGEVTVAVKFLGLEKFVRRH